MVQQIILIVAWHS